MEQTNTCPGLKLFEVTGKNRFCGPTALAAICGITTDQASRVLRSINGKHSITSVSYLHMVQALEFLGCKVRLEMVDGSPTAHQWVMSNAPMYKNQHVILVHGKHYGTLLGESYVCSLSARSVVPVSEIPKKKARVAAYIVVSEVDLSIVDGRKHTQPASLPEKEKTYKEFFGLFRLQDGPRIKPGADKSIPLTQDEYLALERAMQWPEDLAAYDFANQSEHQTA